jgi:hypothetical protein
VIGETENHKPRSSKPSIPAAVTQGPGKVRGSIGLENEASLLAEEIDDKWSDGMLASEFGAHDLPAAQHLPKQAFCWRRAATAGAWVRVGDLVQMVASRQCFRLPSPSRLSIRHRRDQLTVIAPEFEAKRSH